jgi:hypothetical protein
MQHLLGDGLLDAAILGRHSRRAVLEEMVQSGIDLDDLIVRQLMLLIV